MSLIWAIVVGLIAGALAKFVMPGKDPGGLLITLGLGVAGSLVANLLGGALGWYGAGHRAGIIGSTIGAILLLAIYRLIKGKGGTGATKAG
jgi:uncharacterized membrane protein YeaQ/YmgE (transglycosylase-associated protein family)